MQPQPRAAWLLVEKLHRIVACCKSNVLGAAAASCGATICSGAASRRWRDRNFQPSGGLSGVKSTLLRRTPCAACLWPHSPARGGCLASSLLLAPAAQCSMICRQQSSCQSLEMRRTRTTSWRTSGAFQQGLHHAALSAFPKGAAVSSSEGSTGCDHPAAHRDEAALCRGVGRAQHFNSRRLPRIHRHTAASNDM